MASTQADSNHDYAPGSIVRTRMHNFLTYADAEVRPGARLNVIVGPNGSGKSTILCAIALGLGLGANALERGDGVGGYVMRDKEKGYVEIELKGDGENNIVIRRDFERNSNRSSYKVDGKAYSQNAALDIVKALNIQVNNLCTFLPQEKVGKFTELDPQKLLKETMLALRSQNLLETRQKLIEMQQRMKTSGKEKDTLASELARLEEQNKALQRDKDRMEERQKHLAEATLLSKIVRWKEFQVLQNEARTLYSEMEELKRQVEEANEQVAPYQEKVDRLEAKQKEAAANIKGTEAAYRQLNAAAEESAGKLDGQSEAILKAAGEVEDFEKKRALLKSSKQRTQQDLDRAIHDRDNFDVEKNKEEIARLRNEERRLNKLAENKSREVQEAKGEHDEQRAEVESKQKELDNLNNAELQRQNRFRETRIQNARDASDIGTWVNRNRQSFEGRVFGPLALEMSVDDPAVGAMVEAQIPNYLLIAFVVETKKDKELLLEFAAKNKKISLQQLQDKWDISLKQDWYSPQDLEGLQQYGITGVMVDKIKAPPQVIACLRNQANVHRVLIGNARTEEAVCREGLIEKLCKNRGAGGGGDGGGSNAAVVFTTKDDMIIQHRGQISRYAPHNLSTSSKIAQKATVLGAIDESVGRRAKQMEGQIQTLTQRAARAHEELKNRHEEHNTILRERKTVTDKYKNLSKLDKDASELTKKVVRVSEKLAKLESELARDVNQERSKAKKRVQTATSNYINAVVANSDAVENLLKAWTAKLPSKMMHSIATNLHVAAKRVLEAKSEENNELRLAYEAKKLEKEHKMAALKPIKAKLEKELPLKPPNADQELVHAFHDRFKDTPVEEIKTLYDRAAGAAESIIDNPQVVKQYERRKKEIEEKRKQLEKLTDECDNGQDKLKKIAGPWEERLDNLEYKLNIKFSEYMEQMDCAGEVKLQKEENDYEAWGLQLMVKFRKEMKMGKLSAKVQSGGERSVSTILFLMALQEMMDSPFRAVDEINQGMDERNERLIFSRIVANSTKVQYFLVTPKLLPGLTAMEMDHVTVLFVFNAPDLLRYDHWLISQMLEAAGRRGGGGGGGKRGRISSLGGGGGGGASEDDDGLGSGRKKRRGGGA